MLTMSIQEFLHLMTFAGQQSILGSMLEFDFPLFGSGVKGNCFIFRFKFQKLKMPVMYGMRLMKEGNLTALSVVLLIFPFVCMGTGSGYHFTHKWLSYWFIGCIVCHP